MRAGRRLGGALVAALMALSMVAGCSDSAGTESVSLVLSLRNLTSEPINLMLEAEQFGQANLVAPNTNRTPPPVSTVKGRSHTFRAGRDGTVLETVTCTVPEVTQTPRHNARVDWNGTQLTCGTGW